jgi:methylthioribulose-1-phosphate dehydratase
MNAASGSVAQRHGSSHHLGHRHATSHGDDSALYEAGVAGLRQVGELFYSRGWSVGTSSNYSVRLSHDPLRLLITASGKDKGRLGEHDFVVVDETGRPVDPTQPKPSAETLLHVVAAQLPNVGAVLHTHSVWATMLSDLYHADGGFAIEGYEMLKGLDGHTTHETRMWVDIFENTQHIPDLAKIVSERLTDVGNPLRHGYLIRRHGLYTWGKDLAEAKRHVEIYEFLFEVIGRTKMLTAGR